MKGIAACAALALFTAAAQANDAVSEPKPGSQQGKFATCAHESKGLRGEDHQKFMSECLKGELDAPKDPRQAAEPGAQHNRMRTCNDEAARRELHGDERRAFMSSCLKG